MNLTIFRVEKLVLWSCGTNKIGGDKFVSSDTPSRKDMRR
jgi:hypothetical protein